jgi:hypothetical protein
MGMTDIVDWLESESAFYLEVQDIEKKQKLDKAKAEIERLREAMKETIKELEYMELWQLSVYIRKTLEGK